MRLGAGVFRAKPGPKRKIDPLKDFTRLGDPPEDERGLTAYTRRVLALMLRHVATTPAADLGGEQQKRREMLSLIRAINGSSDKASLFEAEELVRGDRQQLADNAAAGPEMEDATELTHGSSPATAKRGRPRR